MGGGGVRGAQGGGKGNHSDRSRGVVDSGHVRGAQVGGGEQHTGGGAERFGTAPSQGNRDEVGLHVGGVHHGEEILVDSVDGVATTKLSRARLVRLEPAELPEEGTGTSGKVERENAKIDKIVKQLTPQPSQIKDHRNCILETATELNNILTNHQQESTSKQSN